jgi:hypothetical protein
MSQNSPSDGLGVPMILFLIFLVLKLTGYITWSWWWVTSPLWIGSILVSILTILIVSLVVLFKKRQNEKTNSNSKSY